MKTPTTASQPATTQHTPGPWSIHENNFAARYARKIMHAGRPLAHLEGDDSQQSIANARLIAAAPELLAALADMEYWFKQPWCSGNQAILEKALNNARAAIQRAKGGAL